jgi:phosphatidylglycerophosphate synthase
VPFEWVLTVGIVPIGLFLQVHRLDYIEATRRMRSRRLSSEVPKAGLWSTALPAVLTLIRLPLGFLVAVLYWRESFRMALWIYLLAQVTDVLDGFAARALNGTSGFGRELDQYADAGFHLIAGIGMVAHAADQDEIGVLIALGSAVAATAVAQIFFGAHTAIAKYVSGGIRVIVFLVLLVHVPPSRTLEAASGVGLAAVAAVYEWGITQREIAVGGRGGFAPRSGLKELLAAAMDRIRRRL